MIFCSFSFCFFGRADARLWLSNSKANRRLIRDYFRIIVFLLLSITKFQKALEVVISLDFYVSYLNFPCRILSIWNFQFFLPPSISLSYLLSLSLPPPRLSVFFGFLEFISSRRGAAQRLTFSPFCIRYNGLLFLLTYILGLKINE